MTGTVGKCADVHRFPASVQDAALRVLSLRSSRVYVS